MRSGLAAESCSRLQSNSTITIPPGRELVFRQLSANPAG